MNSRRLIEPHEETPLSVVCSLALCSETASKKSKQSPHSLRPNVPFGYADIDDGTLNVLSSKQRPWQSFDFDPFNALGPLRKAAYAPVET
jgi:hypothetical protein